MEPPHSGQLQPIVINPRRDEDAELLHKIKEELKENKCEFLRRRLEEI